jgi:hypothetical protein
MTRRRFCTLLVLLFLSLVPRFALVNGGWQRGFNISIPLIGSISFLYSTTPKGIGACVINAKNKPVVSVGYGRHIAPIYWWP